MRIQIKKKQHFVSPYVYAGLNESGVITQLKNVPTKDGLPMTKDTILEVACSICNKFNDTQYLPEDVKGPIRKQQLVEIRHMSTFFMRKWLNAKWVVIAWFLGGRNHSTAINSFKQWDNLSNLSFERRVHQMNNAMCRAFNIKEMH